MPSPIRPCAAKYAREWRNENGAEPEGRPHFQNLSCVSFVAKPVRLDQ